MDRKILDATREVFSKHKISVTPRIADELAAAGIGIPRAVVVGPHIDMDKNTVVVCLTLDDETPRQLPDNATGACSWGCGRKIQFRPYIPEVTQKACVFCVAERGAKDQ